MCVTSYTVYQVTGKIQLRPSAAQRFLQADQTDRSSKLCCVYSASVSQRLMRFTATIWLLGKSLSYILLFFLSWDPQHNELFKPIWSYA